MKPLALVLLATLLTACVTEDPNAPETLMRQDRERAVDEALEDVDTSDFDALL